MDSLQLLKSMGFTAIEIPMRKGWAIVDIDDAPIVLPYSWTVLKSGRTMFYARARNRIGGRNCKRVLMHRLVSGAKEGQDVDHRDGNGLNNRRSNLRTATVSQNLGNMRRLRSDNTSGLKGVHFIRRNAKWSARVQVNGKRICLGVFDTKEAAANAYDEACKKCFGDFAAPNSEIDG